MRDARWSISQRNVLSPLGREQREWRIDVDDLARARCALRIQQDLGVNCAGAALAVELIEEMERLRERVRVLEASAFRREWAMREVR